MVNGSSGATSPSTSQPSSTPSFTSSAATPSRSATRTASAVAIPVPISTACEVTRDAAGRIDLDQGEGRIGAAAEHGADAGETDAVGFAGRRGGAAGLFGRASGPHRLRREPVEHLAAAQRAGDDIADHGLAAGREQVGLAEGDRIPAEARRRFVDHHLERRHGLQRAEAAHRAGGDGARMPRHGRDVDLGNVIDPDRGGGADERDGGGEIGEAAAVEILVGDERGDAAAAAVHRHAAPRRNGMALDAELELVVAVVGEAHRTVRREQPGQRDIERIDGVVLAAEGAADIGAMRDDLADRLLGRILGDELGDAARRPPAATGRRCTSSSLRVPLSYQARPASGSRKTWSIDWVRNVRSRTKRSGPPALISAADLVAVIGGALRVGAACRRHRPVADGRPSDRGPERSIRRSIGE